MKTGSVDSPETSVSKHLTQRHNTEDGGIILNRGGSLRSRRLDSGRLKKVNVHSKFLGVNMPNAEQVRNVKKNNENFVQTALPCGVTSDVFHEASYVRRVERFRNSFTHTVQYRLSVQLRILVQESRKSVRVASCFCFSFRLPSLVLSLSNF
jgi:hypothetical protein